MTDARSWHASTELLEAYVAGDLASAPMASVEAHVGACDRCRGLTTPLADRARLQQNFTEIIDRVGMLRRNPLERWLSRLGVPERVVRVVSVSPADRTPWSFGVLVALLVAAALGGADADGRTMYLLLTVAPLLPLLGVTMSATMRSDPLRELTRSTPMPQLSLIVSRCLVVLVPAAGFSLVLALLVPSWGWEPALWLAPALSLSAGSLALSTWLPIQRVAIALASVWIGGSVIAFIGAPPPHVVTQFVAFRPMGQLALLASAVVAAWVAARRSDSFEMIHAGRIS